MDKISSLISIIVPVYNAGCVLSRCIESLIDQTYESIEIILIDDGSTDFSLSVCEKYAEQTSNITIISQDNGGTAKARNTGLNHSHGEYIMFVDADDYVEKDICEKLYSAVKRTDARCAACGHQTTNENGTIVSVKYIEKEYMTSGKEELLELYCGKNQRLSLVEVWGKLFHYSMWEKIRFTEGLYYEDLEIMPRLFYECETIIEIPYVGYHYLIYEESASHGKSTDDKRIWDSIKIREKHILFFSEQGNYEIAKAIAYRLLELIITCAKHGWIPNNRIYYVLDVFRKHWYYLKRNNSIPLRLRLKYEFFCIRGIHAFQAYRK